MTNFVTIVTAYSIKKGGYYIFFFLNRGGGNPLHVLQFQLLAILLAYLSKLGVTILLQAVTKCNYASKINVFRCYNSQREMTFFIFLKKIHIPLKIYYTKI